MNKFMQIALNEAKKAFEIDEVPVGCVIVKNGEIIAKTHNQNRKNQDSCAHAEILAIQQACKKLQNHRLDECEIYVTLEPCAMCAAAISLAKIQKVYFGAYDEKFGAVFNNIRFFSSNSCYFQPEIYDGIGEIESKKLLQDFFKQKR